MFGKHLVFLDSFQFMSSSLDKLRSNVLGDVFQHTDDVFKGEQLELMKKKRTYPYDFMEIFEGFHETELPPEKAFYSILNDEHVSSEAY